MEPFEIIASVLSYYIDMLDVLTRWQSLQPSGKYNTIQHPEHQNIAEEILWGVAACEYGGYCTTPSNGWIENAYKFKAMLAKMIKIRR